MRVDAMWNHGAASLCRSCPNQPIGDVRVLAPTPSSPYNLGQPSNESRGGSPAPNVSAGAPCERRSSVAHRSVVLIEDCSLFRCQHRIERVERGGHRDHCRAALLHQLRVLIQQGDEVELAGRRRRALLHLRDPGEDHQTLVVGADDVALREVVPVA